MQSLYLSNDLLPAVRSGQKTTTIRDGIRQIGPGPLTFVPAEVGETKVVVDVTKVEIIRLRDVDRVGYHYGYPENTVDLVFQLLKYYPSLTPDSVITVIHFDYEPANATALSPQ